MKNILIIIFLLIFQLAIAQDFDSKLEGLAENIAKKINTKGKKKIAVWGFVTENGEITPLGNYLTEDFSIYITNFGESYEVIDRKHLETLLKEHDLYSEGYIDPQTAKKLRKIIAVDVIITGTYTVIGSKIKLRAKAIDTETALQMAAALVNLEINEDVSSYLGISVNGTSNANKGFNRPINSNENYNNPKTVDSECNKKLIGDFCFYNSNKKKMVLTILFPKYLKNGYRYKGELKKVIYIESGETKCLYNLPSETINYYLADFDTFKNELNGTTLFLARSGLQVHLKDKGQINVETCKSKTYTFR